MFGISGFELFLILLFGFLIFGPDKLPSIAKVIGQGIAKFRKAQAEMNKVVRSEVFDPAADKPVKEPMKEMDKTSKTNIEKKESFSARKAKYDRERAEKKKRDAANEAAKEVREEAQAAAAAAGTTVTKAVPKMHEQVMEARKAASAETQAKVDAERAADEALADELLGIAPAAPAKAAPAAEAAPEAKPADAADQAAPAADSKEE